MRVAIDARKLHDFGIGTYIRNLLRQLARIDRETEYVLLLRESDLGVAAQLGPNFRTVLETVAQLLAARAVARARGSLRRERPDVFHAPHYVLPPAVTCRSVVTIHDCIHLMFPQYLPQPRRLRLRAGVDVDAARKSIAHPHGVGSVEARHPALLQRPAREDRGRLQRHRRALLEPRRTRTTSRACASAIS